MADTTGIQYLRYSYSYVDPTGTQTGINSYQTLQSQLDSLNNPAYTNIVITPMIYQDGVYYPLDQVDPALLSSDVQKALQGMLTIDPTIATTIPDSYWADANGQNGLLKPDTLYPLDAYTSAGITVPSDSTGSYIEINGVKTYFPTTTNTTSAGAGTDSMSSSSSPSSTSTGGTTTNTTTSTTSTDTTSTNNNTDTGQVQDIPTNTSTISSPSLTPTYRLPFGPNTYTMTGDFNLDQIIAKVNAQNEAAYQGSDQLVSVAPGFDWKAVIDAAPGTTFDVGDSKSLFGPTSGTTLTREEILNSKTISEIFANSVTTKNLSQPLGNYDFLLKAGVDPKFIAINPLPKQEPININALDVASIVNQQAPAPSSAYVQSNAGLSGVPSQSVTDVTGNSGQ